MKLNKRLNFSKGFTLIELLLYMAIVAFMMTSLVPLVWNIIEGQAKVAIEGEIYSQARLSSERMKQIIRNSIGINSVSATSISLIQTDSAQNPTIIDLSGEKIRVKIGAASAINLNSDDTTVSSLTFTDYTSSDTKSKHIGFTYTISDNLPSTRQEYQESINIRGSAEVRSN